MDTYPQLLTVGDLCLYVRIYSRTSLFVNTVSWCVNRFSEIEKTPKDN